MPEKITRTIIPAEPGWMFVTPIGGREISTSRIFQNIAEEPVVAWSVEQYTSLDGHGDRAVLYEIVFPVTTSRGERDDPRQGGDWMLRDPDGVYRQNGSTYQSKSEVIAAFVRQRGSRSAHNAAVNQAKRIANDNGVVP
jgi:hypothetical protein